MADTRAALEGLKVVDISQGWAGPMAAVLLGDFGADVVKVESIQRLDWWRGSAAGVDDGLTHERSWFFNGINRNKKDVTLDLASEQGRELLLRLVAEADVFIENFTAHVVKQLRLEHADLAAVNPRIISVSMPAYGSDTSWSDLPALGTTVESMCGVQGLTGYEGGPPRIQGTSWDPVIGLHATYALLAALRMRRRTGRGQHIEVSHIEAGTQLVAPALIETQVTGTPPPRMGNASRTVAPHGCYRTDAEDDWVTIAAVTDEQWQALVDALGSEALRAPQYATLASRLAHRHELDAAIEAVTAGCNRAELVQRLQAAKVPAAPVASPADLLADPHLAEREFFVGLDREYVGFHLYPGPWIRASRTPARVEAPAPTLGQHNEEVLAGRLGLTASEMEKLREARVIGDRPLR